ncbi:MAG TPA: hypothetical protein VMV18_13470, partial [bacterium]|nr:hypothetical protein [bacterium]
AGGYVSLDVIGDAKATFITSAGSASFLTYNLPVFEMPMGCSLALPDPAPTPLAMRRVNAGPSVTLADGTTTIVLTNDGAQDYSAYAPGGSVPEDSDWDLTVTGTGELRAQTIRRALHVPSRIHLPPTIDSIPASGPFRLGWNAAGADFVVIMFGTTASGPACRVADTGGFDLPADIVAAIPAGNGTIAFHAVSLRERLVGSRSVEFVGTTLNFRGYTKPVP